VNIQRIGIAVVVAFGVSAAFLSACTQMPTEQQKVVDHRPQIAFNAPEQSHGARVIVDGLDMGAVGDYLEGSAALRVLPGTHVIRLEQAGRPIFEEKIYVGDGVGRTILVR
jgi:hypothetical protein